MKLLAGKNNYFWFSIFCFAVIVVQLTLIRLSNSSIVPVVFLLVTAALLVFYYYKNIPLILIFLASISFIYINDDFNYQIKYIILQDIPLYFLFLLALAKYFLTFGNLSFEITPLKRAVIFLFAFSVIAVVIGFANNYDKSLILTEFYNLFYYVLMIPLVYLITDSREYRKIFVLLLILSLIVAIEYIYNNSTSSRRFTSFHAGFFPVVAATLFALLIHFKRNFYLFSVSVVSLIIILSGTFFTLTRSLWASVFISLTYVLVDYFRISKIKFFGFAFLLIIFSLFMQQDNLTPRAAESLNYNTRDRIQGVAAPQTDASFLMRIELGYYAIQEFLKSPVLGAGLGDQIAYQFLGRAKVSYLDNSWLYFLWKGGIVGFLIFLLLYIRFFKECSFIIKNTNDPITRIFCIGILSGFAGFIVFSLFSANLLKYSKTNLFYAIIFSYIELEANKIRNSSGFQTT